MARAAPNDCRSTARRAGESGLGVRVPVTLHARGAWLGDPARDRKGSGRRAPPCRPAMHGGERHGARRACPLPQGGVRALHGTRLHAPPKRALHTLCRSLSPAADGRRGRGKAGVPPERDPALAHLDEHRAPSVFSVCAAGHRSAIEVAVLSGIDDRGGTSSHQLSSPTGRASTGKEARPAECGSRWPTRRRPRAGRPPPRPRRAAHWPRARDSRSEDSEAPTGEGAFASSTLGCPPAPWRRRPSAWAPRACGACTPRRVCPLQHIAAAPHGGTTRVAAPSASTSTSRTSSSPCRGSSLFAANRRPTLHRPIG
jgi:hypothetical protein